MSVWDHLVQHKEEIIWAAVFGVIFALLFEIINPSSHIRAKIRQLNNRWAEHSNYLLAQRIEELEKYKKQLSDVRWHYFMAFQMVFIFLICAALSALFWMLSDLTIVKAHPGIEQQFIVSALGSVLVGISSAASGFKHVRRDSPEKMQSFILEVGQEIESLQKTLKDRSARASAAAHNTTAHSPSDPSAPLT